ncbi:exodeoxyribonuclease VII large subunit [Thioalkalivibrio paradoxus]|uniref:Exodeoxyribonuclease 7 large subunit n=1 Tax=Thioalkalivibrio paradoxus ARh 1 TaxID=713585 RepID=W0DK54_9GAMM|nr:exodeoxyribonuclease VII large subunit [Thioalkalivibrio paradoxus]AHE98984.1 exodeoxyribonuclease VII large subunit [Thioalkalivibrio paradoxus ARh 1]
MTSERSVLSVNQLNQQADRLLRAELGSVWVEGEVSNLRRYASGHQYFSLKDEQASVSCTLFRGNARNASPFADGNRVVVFGRAGVYAARGQFQLVVERLESAGEGQLLLEFQRLKERLLAEGLFAAERKRALPRWVHRLGVITSPQGDVQHDIARTLARRFPLLLPFRLYPVAVQGAAAAPQLVQALELAGREHAVDVLILARGGGSLEDLWAFNEEAVARAIADCPIPVVTGIGHETDTTIADYVADLRASTPTAAAEAVSPDATVLNRQLADAAARLDRTLAERIRDRRRILESLNMRLQRAHPGRRVEQHLQRVDELQQRLQRAIHRLLDTRQARLRQLTLTLRVHSPAHRTLVLRSRLQQLRHRLLQARPSRLLQTQQRRLDGLRDRLKREVGHQLERQTTRLAVARGRLRALDPDAVLERGYSILLTRDRQVVRKAEPALQGEPLRARLASGALDLRVEAVHPADREGKPASDDA